MIPAAKPLASMRVKPFILCPLSAPPRPGIPLFDPFEPRAPRELTGHHLCLPGTPRILTSVVTLESDRQEVLSALRHHKERRDHHRRHVAPAYFLSIFQEIDSRVRHPHFR